jgi:hypothetical protein
VEEAADLLPLANKDLKSVSYLDLFLEGFKILCGPGDNIHLGFEIMAHLFELVTVSLLDVLDHGCDINVLTVVSLIISSFVGTSCYGLSKILVYGNRAKDLWFL